MSDTEDYNRSDLKRSYHTDSDSNDDDYVNYDGRRIESTSVPTSPVDQAPSPADDSEEGAIDAKSLPHVPKHTSPERHTRKRIALSDQKTDRPTSADVAYTRASNPDYAKAYTLSIRALLTRKESGVVIGKAGSNVAEIRDKSGARVHLGDGNNGATERVVQVVGSLEIVAKAYGLIATHLTKSVHSTDDHKDAYQQGEPNVTTVRLLLPHLHMGSIIGKAGSKIKEIQDASGARVVASEPVLPNSTERIVSVTGTPEAIETAVERIGAVLQHHLEKSKGVIPGYIPYHPEPGHGILAGNGSILPSIFKGGSGQAGAGAQAGAYAYPQQQQQQQQYAQNVAAGGMYAGYGASSGYSGYPGYQRYGQGVATQMYYPTQNYMATPAVSYAGYGQQQQTPQAQPTAAIPSTHNAAGAVTQQIFIPNELVGSIIGKAGRKINEIRQKSGSHVKIEDEMTGATERLVTIRGLPENNQMALYLLYQRLEEEKARHGANSFKR